MAGSVGGLHDLRVGVFAKRTFATYPFAQPLQLLAGLSPWTTLLVSLASFSAVIAIYFWFVRKRVTQDTKCVEPVGGAGDDLVL